ncbi:MFS transporter [Spirillospora sp. NPDC127200]
MRSPTLPLSLGHGGVDFYQGIVPVLVPFLVAERHYGYVEVAGFVLAATLLSSVVQPLFGMLTDRRPMPWLVPAGTLTAGLGAAWTGLTDSYALTLMAMALTGAGVAAYHPEAARLARTLTSGDHKAMSWFSLGGNIGFASAPILATPLLAAGGLKATPYLLAPAILATLITLPVLNRRTTATRTPRQGASNWPAFRTLSGIVILRSITYVGLTTFLTLYVQQRVHPGSTATALALLTLFAGGAVGTVLGGHLAGKWGRVPTIRRAYLTATLAVAGVALVPGPLLYAFIALAAMTLYIPFSLHITLGQDYLPTRMGTASGVTLGLAVSIGGVFAPVLGTLAETTSLHTTFLTLAAFPALAWLLAGRLNEETPSHQVEEGVHLRRAGGI